MKKVLLRIVLGIAICLIIYLMWLPGMKALPFRASEGHVYIADYITGDNFYNYILKFTSAIDMSIYQYKVGADDVIYGKRTDYTFSGK